MSNRFKRFVSIICALSMLMTSMAGSFASELEGNQATPPANDPPVVTEPATEPAPESVQEPPAAEPEATSDEENTPPEEPEAPEGSDESEESVDEGQTGSDEGTPDEPGTEPAGDTEKDPAGESDGKRQDKPVQDDTSKQQDEPAKDQPNGQQDGEAKPADQNQTGEGKTAEQNPDGKDQEKPGQTDQPEEQGTVPAAANGSVNDQGPEQGAAPVNQDQAQPEQNQTGAQEAPVPQNQNETQEPETPPTAIQAEQNEDEGLNELTVNGGRKSAAADPETPVRMFLKAEKTETILLTITLAADDEIDLQINSASQSPAETTLNEEETEKALTFRKDVETGNAYLLEISAKKKTDFSIEAVSVPEENPDEQKPEEDDEDNEQTEVQNSNKEKINPEETISKEGTANADEAYQIVKPDEISDSPETPSADNAPLEIPEGASVSYQVHWDGEAAIGEIAHFVSEVTGLEQYSYRLQWQSSTDNVNWSDIDGETGEAMDILITDENCDLYWRIELVLTEKIEENADVNDSSTKGSGFAEQTQTVQNETITNAEVDNNEDTENNGDEGSEQISPSEIESEVLTESE